MNASTLNEVREIAGLFSDAMLVEEGRLRFLSIIGLDTAIRELQARLTVPSSSPERIHQLTVGTTVISATETSGWRQLAGRVKTRLFGDLVQLFIYDPLAVDPDRGSGRALLLERGEVQPSDERLWALLREVCAYPLLEHWRDAVLNAFRSLEWIRQVGGCAVHGCWIDLSASERVGIALQRMIRCGVLTREPEDDLPPLPDLSDLRADAVAAAPDPIEEGPFAGFELIHSYTRAQAIEDGVLVDVSHTSEAREAGFRLPVAMTRTVWDDCVAWSDEDSRRQVPQDEQGRLWDLLYMASRSMVDPRHRDRSELIYQIVRVPRGGRGVKPKPVSLKLTIGAGDDGEPVITLMMPDED